MKKLIILLAVMQLATFEKVHSQEEDPWWKQLFKQDAPASTEEEPKNEVGEEKQEGLLENYKIAREEEKLQPRELTLTEGKLTVRKDPRIDSLDQRMIREPRQLRGYRVQIFFGDLSSAREARAEFVQLNFDESCYLEQSPPNFGVRVGDFRTREEAYEVLVRLKKEYPTAYIVPAQIELPRLPDQKK